MNEINEAAKYSGVTKVTVRNLIKKTDILACKIVILWKLRSTLPPKSEAVAGYDG